MTAQIIPYFYKGKPVRVTLWNGAPWFVLADIAVIFDIGNSRDIAARLPDHQRHVDTIDTSRGPRQATIISEAALYKIAFRSNKPEAEYFTNWVAEDVLPSIRKTGSYHADGRSEFLSAIERLVEPIKGRFTEHDEQLTQHGEQLHNHEIRLVAVEGKIINPDWKRKDFSAKDKRRLARCIDACYGRMDPVAGLHQITDGRGHFLPHIAEIDHFNNNRRDNRIENALPTHESTHRRKTTGENFLPAFNEFHRKRLEFERAQQQPSLFDFKR